MGIRRVYLDIILVVFICQAVCAQVPAATGSSIAYVGETVTIDCPLADNFIYPAWRGPDRSATDGAQIRYSYEGSPAMPPGVSDHISYATNKRTLILTGVTKADASTYECIKTIDGVSKRGVHTLHVRVLPGLPVILNTEIIGGVSSVRGTEGQPLTMTCVCHGGFPPPTLAWYRNTVTSTSVASTPGTDGTSVTVTYTLDTPGKNDDQDTYICQSSFQDPQPEAINQTTVQLYLNLKPSTPTVQQIGDATAGSNATLQCDTSGFRPAATITISWTYKGTVPSGSLPTVSWLGNDKYRATSTLELPVQRGDNRGSVECIVDHYTLSSPRSAPIAMNVLFAPVSVHVSGNTQTEVGTNPLTLTCTVGDANPAVSGYSWTGPGVGGMTSRIVTLTPTRHQDGLPVTCTATNTVGSTVSQAVNLDLTYHPITTILEGTSVTKTEGDLGLVLHCLTDSKPVSTITWSHNNIQVMQGTNNNQLNYNVGRVDMSDYGSYTCSAYNGITGSTADMEKSVTLAVLFSPLTVELTGYTPGMVANGVNTLTLTCTAGYSRPVSTIVWKEGSSQISTGITSIALPGSQYGGTRYRETLTLTPTREDDGTNITCSAWNNVTAQQLMDTVQLDLRYRPEANIPGGDKTVIEGTPNIYLKCTASSKPVATFTWYKGTTWLGTDTGTQADNSWSYRIDEVSRSHSGQYKCKANNGISPVDQQTMTLTVQYPPDVTATGHDGTVNDTSMTITCSASGVPDSYAYNSWMHTWSNGQLSSHKLELAATQSLTLTNLTYKHSGIYTCRVSNGIAPYDTPAAYIREGSTSVITIKSNPVIIDKVNKVATKLHQPTNINITYYSNVGVPAVSCHRVVNNVTQSASVGVVTTEPAVIQLPMLDNSTVPASGIRATVNLTIDHESELGLYQVKLRNAIGTTTLDLQIQPKGPPEPPEHPAVSGVSTTSVNVSWNLGFHRGFSQAFVVQYSIDSVAWTDGAKLDTGRNESPNRHQVSVDSLSPGQLYYLRIYAYNEKGQSDYTDTFNVTTSTPVTDGESAASTDIGPIVGGLVAALVVIIIVVVACVFVLYTKGYRITRPGNKRDKYSAHVYEDDFGTDTRKSPNVTRCVPATPATQDNGPSATTSAGTEPGPVYEQVDGDPQVGAGSRGGSPSATASEGTVPGPVYEQVDGNPQVGAGSRDESITATYEMLERRQSENRTYDELQVPAPPEYENTRIP